VRLGGHVTLITCAPDYMDFMKPLLKETSGRNRRIALY